MNCLSDSEITLYDEQPTCSNSQSNLLRSKPPSCFWRCCALIMCCAAPNKNRARVAKKPAIILHKPARQGRYKTRKYHTSGIDHQWQADLVVMQEKSKYYEGFKYILTVIDIFSMYAWAESIKTKSPQHVKPAFELIYSKGRKPFKIQTDQVQSLRVRQCKIFQFS